MTAHPDSKITPKIQSAIDDLAGRYDAAYAVFVYEHLSYSVTSHYRTTGKAWERDMVNSLRGWEKPKPAKFIPPSPETLTWGGFLGGEYV